VRDVVVRPAGKGDGDGMAAAWLDAGRTYAELDPELFRVPDAKGLPASIETWIADVTGEKEALIVAEIDGVVVGWVSARLEEAVSDPEAQLVRDVTDTRLFVDGLVVGQAHRRRGIGTRLMIAAEEWGRGRGARLALLDTWGESPESVPFYEQLGYAPRSVRFRKRLTRP
jgi:GNAT superfamily N-acetyltransferase